MERVLTGLTVLLYVVMRLWRLTHFSLQRDEIFSLETARLTWHAMFAEVVADAVHPPLFYILLKIWILITGESLFSLRILPTLIAIAALVPFLLLCRELNVGATVCILALFLFAVNGYFIAYAHEVRMYSLLLCLTLIALWLFVRFFRRAETNRGELIWLFAVHLLLVFTHYYAWLVIGAELLFLTIWKRERLPRFAVIVGLISLCFLPWVFSVLNALQTRAVGLTTQLSWHTKPGLVDVAAYYALLNGAFSFAHSTTIGLLIFLTVIAIVTFQIWQDRWSREENGRDVFFFLVVTAFLPPVLAFTVSRLTGYSIWLPRYLIVSGVPYLLLIAFALLHLRIRSIKRSLVVIVVIWAAVSGATQITQTDTRIEWNVLAMQIRQNEPASTGPITIYTFDEFPRYPMNFHLQEAGDRRFRFVQITPGDLAKVSDERFWVVYLETTWTQEDSPQKILLAKGYNVGPSFASGPPRRGYTAVAARRNGLMSVSN
jgi:hypothetical protein